MSRHAARIIKQFMAACCGKTKRHEDADDAAEEGGDKAKGMPENSIPLQRVHAILDRMSVERLPKERKRIDVKKTFVENLVDDLADEEDLDAHALRQSNVVNDAMQTTARLWSRSAQAWPEEIVDKCESTLEVTKPSKTQDPKRQQHRCKQEEAKAHQCRAYLKWNEAQISDWLVQLQREEEAPNAKQSAFLERVIERCRREALSLQSPRRKEYEDEPVRDCLLGLPGTGKSTCIKLMRRFFEECLGWEDGVQFQFLAPQNTMAALIGGATVHTWGTIPVNATDAASKVHTKGDDGDIDELFLNALGVRWLVVDEISSLALSLLGLLDAYLRRACNRHPYARHGKRHRPFGGINLVLAGDFWQLPPVRANAIFSNPFKKDCYGLEEQKILKMFWVPEDADSIQKTWVLTEPMRTKDEWLKAVLDADRYGIESWEMYCFVHGFPTRNPGTWTPGREKPACNNKRCAELAADIWPRMWQRGQGTWENWLLRRELECVECAAERKRRCCVLRENDEEDKKRFVSEPFAGAAYVHPFRHPSFHATQLRAIVFAKSKKRRLLWVTAYDKILTNNLACSKDKEELRKERWLEFHDRFTAGIPGLLPLVLDLPMRFTESINRKAREMGVFKHSRGILRGWKLPEEEESRLAALDDPEVVLVRRPLELYIEVATPTKATPTVDGKRIFTLTVQAKAWSLDKAGAVKIQRFGFPIVPDFGGTAHAYCGTTMDAALGDLLPWTLRPRLEDMLKAYIIKSRIRAAENLMIAQPYSPHLFRQGVLPGPQLLLDVLEGGKTTAQAKDAWKEYEKKKREKTSGGAPWMLAQELPCRRCTDLAKGDEVWKPVSSFSSSQDPEILKKTVLQKGQDLVCRRCTHHLQWGSITDAVIPCDGCGAIKSRCKFDEKNKQTWQTFSEDPIYCIVCLGGRPTRKDAKMVFCSGSCRKKLPAYQFVDAMLAEWEEKQTLLEAQCARCVVQRKEHAEKEAAECHGCHETKCITRFGPMAVKDWLTHTRTSNRWRCYDCQYPACVLCAARPLHAIPHNGLLDGKYYCEECRYPPCKCGKRRENPGGKQRFLSYTCEECAAKGDALGRDKSCKRCGQANDVEAFDVDARGRLYAVCRKCQHPPCEACGKKIDEIWTPRPSLCEKQSLSNYTCEACSAGCQKTCQRCMQAKGVKAFDVDAQGRLYAVCRKCQHPPCEACGKKLDEIWTPSPRAKNPKPICHRCLQTPKQRKR